MCNNIFTIDENYFFHSLDLHWKTVALSFTKILYDFQSILERCFGNKLFLLVDNRIDRKPMDFSDNQIKEVEYLLV